ncbi:hypothetical protein HU200_041046 [Digitaria exilis]|uniref:Uncharacterized protein n=1 Tax=Digitaria exilis TaxID=1010633 RepID=A0A835B7Y0_9POAL|nr:hypothetical protein HU200_041046 [Digitaria exilis]
MCSAALADLPSIHRCKTCRSCSSPAPFKSTQSKKQIRAAAARPFPSNQDLFLLLPRPKQIGQNSSRSPAKFTSNTPPPADSSHPWHHNLPVSIQDQAQAQPSTNSTGITNLATSIAASHTSSIPPPLGEQARLLVGNSRLRRWTS